VLSSRFPDVTVHAVALGEQSGSLEFQEVVDAPALSGFAQGDLGNTHQVRRHQVMVKRLDDVLPPDKRVDFIKIDVEGAELGVLKGAIETIRRCRPVLLFEHQKSSATRTGADTYGVTPAQVHAFVSNELGYRLFDIDGRGPLSSSEFEQIVTLETNRNFVAHSIKGATNAAPFKLR
jgi:FkbM family methyltransferase